jgi:hypothetical protein
LNHPKANRGKLIFKEEFQKRFYKRWGYDFDAIKIIAPSFVKSLLKFFFENELASVGF